MKAKQQDFSNTGKQREDIGFGKLKKKQSNTLMTAGVDRFNCYFIYSVLL
jgi:hypothetical protein